MTTEARYYIASYTHVVADQGHDSDLVVISTKPCVTNSSREVRINGWCGTTNDVSLEAHGEYDTLEAARRSAEETVLMNDFREIHADGEPEDAGVFFDPDVVAAYRVGAAPSLSAEESVDWMNGFRETGIKAETTDEEIVEMAKAWSADSIENGGARLDIPAIVSAAIDYRIELAREALGMDDEDEAA